MAEFDPRSIYSFSEEHSFAEKYEGDANTSYTEGVSDKLILDLLGSQNRSLGDASNSYTVGYLHVLLGRWKQSAASSWPSMTATLYLELLYIDWLLQSKYYRWCELDDLLDDLNNQQLQRRWLSEQSGARGGFLRRRVRASEEYKLKWTCSRLSDFFAVERFRKWWPYEGANASASTFAKQYFEQNTPSPVFCGRDAEKEELICHLLTRSTDEQPGKLSVLPIVGMVGIGKTSLAHAVFRDPRIKARFDHRQWIRAGQVFDAQKNEQELAAKIAGERGFSIIPPHLPEQLRSKRFLLVLDDVWCEDATDWYTLRFLFHSCRPGSKILVTTRSFIVAKKMGTTALYILEALSDDSCWEIFKQSAFGRMSDAIMTPALVQMGKEISVECRGLPLAAVLFGNHMRTKGEEFEWSTNIEDELCTCKQKILSSLMAGYDRMPTHLKKCFAYCSIFPKDYRIDRLKLIYLWFAEGFIDTSSDSRPLEEIGNDYFDYMLQNFFFQDEQKDDYGNIMSCKMHHLIHDLACFVAGNASYVVNLGKETLLPHGCFYLSVICEHGKFSEILTYASGARDLRTLFIFGQTQHLDWAIVEFMMRATRLRALQCSGFPIRKFPTTYGKFRYLRFLDLSDTMIESVDESITNLYYLHFLDLSNTNIEVLPASITALYNLQILKVGHCVKLQELPLVIGKLENLRLLDLSHSVLQALPESIASLCSLQTLNLSGCNKLQKLPLTIGELCNLRVLSLSCSRIQSLPGSIADLTNLQTLDLRDCTEIKELPEGMQNMVNLNHLEIRGCQLTCMPCCLGSLNLETLPLFVVGSKPGHTIEELQHLNHLRGVLKITCLGNVKHPKEAMMANLASKEGLHSLELRWRTGWARKWGEVMINLAAISQPSNENLDMDVVFQNLQPHENLRHLTVEDYGGSKFPTWLSESLQKLESFSLYNLEKCEHLPPLGHLPSLKHLQIESAYALNCIDTFGGIFLSLKYLKLWNLPSLKEWFVPSRQEMFPSLETLIIVGCPELKIKTHLPSSLMEFEMESVNEEVLIGGWLEGLSRLRKLRIAHFEAPESWWEGMQFLISLESMEIMNCLGTTLPNCILQRHFPSLQTLKLMLNNDLKSLGEAEGGEPPLFFSELHHLSIQGCDELTELPEWLCGLNFLDSMELSLCDNLEMIPSKLHTDLGQLTIFGCPKLEVNERGA